MKTQKSRLSRDRDLSRCDDDDDDDDDYDEMSMNRNDVDEFQFIHRQIASLSKIDFSSGNWISVMASLSAERKWSNPQPSPVNEQNTRLRMIRLGFRVLTSRKYCRATTARVECTPAELKAIISKIFVESGGTRGCASLIG